MAFLQLIRDEAAAEAWTASQATFREARRREELARREQLRIRFYPARDRVARKAGWGYTDALSDVVRRIERARCAELVERYADGHTTEETLAYVAALLLTDY